MTTHYYPGYEIESKENNFQANDPFKRMRKKKVWVVRVTTTELILLSFPRTRPPILQPFTSIMITMITIIIGISREGTQNENSLF